MTVFSKKELEQKMGEILWKEDFFPSVEALEQYLDGSMSSVTLKVTLFFNGMVNPDEIKTEEE
jgi:hypothetical protein